MAWAGAAIGLTDATGANATCIWHWLPARYVAPRPAVKRQTTPASAIMRVVERERVLAIIEQVE